MENIFDDSSKGWFRRVRNIVEHPKSLNDFIKDEKFLVEKVVCNSEKIKLVLDFNVYNEYGGVTNTVDPKDRGAYDPEAFEPDENKMHSMDGGYITTNTLTVIPLNKNCPIRTLTFEGYTPIIGGNIISAKVLKYFLHTFSSSARSRTSEFGLRDKIVCIERPYNSTESALEISLHKKSINYFINRIFKTSLEEKTIRVDKSIEYKKYFS